MIQLRKTYRSRPCQPYLQVLIVFSLPLILLLVSACGLFTAEPEPDISLYKNAPLSLTVLEKTKAGRRVIITVQAPTVPDDIIMTMTVVGSFGVRVFEARILDERAIIALDETLTQYAGLINIKARLGSNVVEGSLLIEPGEPNGPILALLAPRSVVANGVDSATVVAFPADKYGNRLRANVPVTVEIQHPSHPHSQGLGLHQVITTTTHDLYSWVKIPSGTVAGKTLIGISTAGGHSAEQVLIEIPQRPIDFSVTTQRKRIPADGRQLVPLETTPLQDKHGNPVLDGTHVTFLMTDPAGNQRSIPAITLDSKAEVTVQAPRQPGLARVQALTSGTLSEPLDLIFTPGPTIKDIPVETIITAETVVLKAGPLIGDLGQFVADGSLIEFVVYHPTDLPLTKTAPSHGGYATAIVRRSELGDGEHAVTIQVGTGQGIHTFMHEAIEFDVEE
ncbi:MAG: hypothetical protein AAF485_00405 [Chloroflexota bacterium]